MVIALSSFAFGISLSPLISLIAGILILIMPLWSAKNGND